MPHTQHPIAPTGASLAPQATRATTSAPRNDLLLRAARGELVERTPVWFMRQAGRYLPEYRAVRARADFLTMVRTPELAAEVTLQPVDLIGVDAAIIFSDILVVPEAMGMALTMDEGKGPSFDHPIRSVADLARLRDPHPDEDLAPTLDAIRLVRRELDGRVPLIGFAGGPWTLFAYMVEGKGTKHFQIAKRMLMEEPALAHALLDRIGRATARYVMAQVAAGAQVIQLFESWAGALGPQEFRDFALPYLTRVAGAVRSTGVPVIVFAPYAGWALREVAVATQCEVIGIDWQTDPQAARDALAGLDVTLQGNFDPCGLYASPEKIRQRTRRMLDAFGGQRHIANLGHGVLPDVSPAHARAFVDAVREWRATPRALPTLPARRWGVLAS
jgi:uroporphyrinogen decarboxylase